MKLIGWIQDEYITFRWIIENGDGEKVGEISTFDCERRVGVFKYAILIRRPYWRRGYASEAIKIVARYYFHELGYQKLTALVYSFNERSLRMHEKLGFVFEGRLRRTVYTNGLHYDTIYFGITKEEFDRLDPPPPLWEDGRYVVSPVASIQSYLVVIGHPSTVAPANSCKGMPYDLQSIACL